MKLSVNLFMTLDGVSQGPGSAEEDTRGEFHRGGWLMPVFDNGCGEAVNGWYERCGALLLGRRTFDTFATHWPHVTDPADGRCPLSRRSIVFLVGAIQDMRDDVRAGTVRGADIGVLRRLRAERARRSTDVGARGTVLSLASRPAAAALSLRSATKRVCGPKKVGGWRTLR